MGAIVKNIINEISVFVSQYFYQPECWSPFIELSDSTLAVFFTGEVCVWKKGHKESESRLDNAWFKQ